MLEKSPHQITVTVHLILTPASSQNYGDSAFNSDTSLIGASVSAIVSIECTVTVTLDALSP